MISVLARPLPGAGRGDVLGTADSVTSALGISPTQHGRLIVRLDDSSFLDLLDAMPPPDAVMQRAAIAAPNAIHFWVVEHVAVDGQGWRVILLSKSLVAGKSETSPRRVNGARG